MSLFSVGHCSEITGSSGLEQLRKMSDTYKQHGYVRQGGMMQSPQADTFQRKTTDDNCTGKTVNPKLLINLADKVPASDRTPESIAKIEDGLRIGIIGKDIISKSTFEDSMVRTSHYATGASFPGYRAQVFFDKDKNNRAVLIENEKDKSSVAAYFKNNRMYLYEFDGKTGKQKTFSHGPSSIQNAKTMPIKQLIPEVFNQFSNRIPGIALGVI